MYYKFNHGLICPAIIARYKQECKATGKYERKLKQIYGAASWKAMKSDLNEIALAFCDIDSDEYQKQKVLNSVYRDAIAHMGGTSGNNEH